jgi:hypothetical protein
MTSLGNTISSLFRNSFTKFLEQPLTSATPFSPEVTGTDMEFRRFHNTISGIVVLYPAFLNFLVIAS